MVDQQLAEWEPLDEVPAAGHSTGRADRHPAQIVDEIEAMLDHRVAYAGPDQSFSSSS